MKKIILTDISLAQAALPGKPSLSFREKTEIAKLLDSMGVDVIHLPAPSASKADELLVKTLAPVIQGSVLAVSVRQSAEESFRAVMDAKKPRLVVSLPVSTAIMEYEGGKKPSAMLELIKAQVSGCAALCNDVEFQCQDATRAEEDFLVSAIEAAVSAGATTITLCDTAAVMLPDELSAFIEGLYEKIPALSAVNLAVSCSDAIRLSSANALSAILSGACEIKVTANGADCTGIETIAGILRSRGDDLSLSCGLDMTRFNRVLSQIQSICSSEKPATSALGGISPGQGSEVSLSSQSSISDLKKALALLGYTLSDGDLSRVFEQFSRIAVKKNVTAKDLDAIVAQTAVQVPETYKVKSYVLNSGNKISATANICIEKGSELLCGLSVGDGPIDASFLAIEQIVGRKFELEDFQIQAVTQGRTAMGSTLVKLRSSGKLYSGRGLSTDVIGASIRAYVDAINKIVYEENQI
ncbi:hypothetical protein LJC01_02350 [Clostridiaceae bacterium OttesenSCG-928-D20]|nr:hypothetical protein [Clostridiaceae bacterium OttesenSCG-928-D20]